jgi:hypothetical protein
MLLFAGLASLSGTGCLIAEAPDYGAPRKTTPVIDQGSVVPQPTNIVIAQRGVPLTFDMTIFSEDAGDILVASYFLNYKTKREAKLGIDLIPPRAADEPKDHSYTIIPGNDYPKGCNTVTLFLTHYASYDANGTTQLPIPKKSDGDVATLTWWLDVQGSDTSAPIECRDLQ